VVAQLQAVVSDIGVGATKTGMLLNQEIITAVAQQLEILELTQLVVDPVMVSRTGAQLLADEAIATLGSLLIPQALIITPNRYEAQILSSLEINSLGDMQTAAQRIHSLGAKYVLIKGGGMAGELQGVDVWFDGQEFQILQTTRVDTKHTHGTGCTLSSAIAANLALGKSPLEAAQAGKTYVTKALQHSLAIGSGTGPVGHFYPLLPSFTNEAEQWI
jgi:hydroxymethylpyrimidine/phosphomethylpyrimidine kinase